MKVGVPTEIKPDEYRVALTPAGMRELREHGHEVLVQRGAGEGRRSRTRDYEAQGARILPDAESVFAESELVLGVKEPQPGEVAMLRPEHMLFTYLHLAPAPELTRGLCETGATCIAYETVEDAQGGCRCWRRCPRWRARSRHRRGRSCWRSRSGAAACCWAACPGWRPPTCS